MKAPLTLICAFILFSCNSDNLKGYSRRTIQLKNEIGTLSIYLPEEIDAFYQYKRYSDYKCADTYVFLFSNSNYTIDTSKDYIDSTPIDSLYCLMIKQPLHQDCYEKGYHIDSNFNDRKGMYMETITPHLSYNGEVLRINKRRFVIDIFSYKDYKDSSKLNSEVKASTIIENELLSLNFKCFRKDTAGFVNRMITSLKTLEIDSAVKK